MTTRWALRLAACACVLRSVGAAAPPLVQPRPLHPDDCASYASKGSMVDDAWCNTNCGAGNCPADLCECAGLADSKGPASIASNGTDAGTTTKIEKAVKVDMGGEKGLPFEKAIIGYYGSGPYTPFENEKGPSIADALKQGYNVICLSFADSFTGDGGFQLHTDLCPTNKRVCDNKKRLESSTPSKAAVSKEAGIPIGSWKYLLSFGGAAGPGPKMKAMDSREASEDAFAEGFVKTYKEVKAKYGFDGVDIDVESSLSTPLLSAFRKIFIKLHKQGELVTMAPETPSLDPGEVPSFLEGAYNTYAPLTDTSIINHVSWVAPQMYNDQIPYEENPVEYVKSLQAGTKLQWDGREIEVNIPANKLVLGFPATRAAGPARAMPAWEEPDALLETFRNSPELKAIKGVMTWSVGHDYSNGWKWVKAMKQIWKDDSAAM